MGVIVLGHLVLINPAEGMCVLTGRARKELSLAAGFPGGAAGTQRNDIGVAETKARPESEARGCSPVLVLLPRSGWSLPYQKGLKVSLT